MKGPRPAFLNSREARVVSDKINEQWDADFKFEDFVYKSTKDKFYLVSRDLEMINYKDYYIENYGVYFCHENFKNKEIRLSVEGAQIIGPLAKKNVVELDSGLMKLWMSGHDIPYSGEAEGMIIAKFEGDYLGCGKIKVKEVVVTDENGNEQKEEQRMILNFVPKTRRHVKD